MLQAKSALKFLQKRCFFPIHADDDDVDDDDATKIRCSVRLENEHFTALVWHLTEPC